MLEDYRRRGTATIEVPNGLFRLCDSPILAAHDVLQRLVWKSGRVRGDAKRGIAIEATVAQRPIMAPSVLAPLYLCLGFGVGRLGETKRGKRLPLLGRRDIAVRKQPNDRRQLSALNGAAKRAGKDTVLVHDTHSVRTNLFGRGRNFDQRCELPKGRANEALDCRVYAYAALCGLRAVRKLNLEHSADTLETMIPNPARIAKTEFSDQPVARQSSFVSGEGDEPTFNRPQQLAPTQEKNTGKGVRHSKFMS